MKHVLELLVFCRVWLHFLKLRIEIVCWFFVLRVKAPSKTHIDTPSNSPNGSIINGEIDVPIFPDSSKTLTVALPPSDLGFLITMSQVSADNDDAVPVARSYDGHDFETLNPLLLLVDCNAGSCSVDIPSYSGQAAMHYIIQEYIPQAKTTAQDSARLLLQGTYGPTQTSLSEAMAIGSAAVWVRDQMNKPASFLRAHYRRRANAYTKNDLHHHGTRIACEQGSRWARHAFNRWRDVGKTIIEEDTGTGSYYLKIDGIVRTEVATRPSVEFSLSSTSYVICRNIVEDEDFVKSMQMSSFVEAPTGEKGTLVVAGDANSCMNMFTASKSELSSRVLSTESSKLMPTCLPILHFNLQSTCQVCISAIQRIYLLSIL